MRRRAMSSGDESGTLLSDHVFLTRLADEIGAKMTYAAYRLRQLAREAEQRARLQGAALEAIREAMRKEAVGQ
jgi:hypothetical protein